MGEINRQNRGDDENVEVTGRTIKNGRRNRKSYRECQKNITGREIKNQLVVRTLLSRPVN